MDVHLDIAWQLGRGQAQPASAQLFRLLRAIDEHGSLAHAARSLDISYRNAWNLVNQWSDQMGQALVSKERGRGASLTPLGKKLLWAQDYAHDKSEALLNEIAGELREALDTVDTDAVVGPITIFASHCLTHSILSEVFRQRTSTQINIKNAGSAKALSALRDGLCDAAGFHLAEGDLKPDFVERYRQFIDPKQHTLIHALTRRQGLIIAAGNPKNIRSINDLTKPNVRLVNRQSHSGTRMILDSLLRRHDISTSRVNGYDTVEFTHSAVSALVASGSVDVTLGTEASAAQFGLEFIGLANESYFYAVANDNVHSPATENLSATLACEAFRKQVRKLKGYNPDESGLHIPAEKIFS
ncbi:MAG: helix-turn-helix transcriptional regulator [Gammaproteobacteria bacterium]|nr:helix-turn-helix transcriptional regulator [Gammaproteobacteria bacterium]